MAQRQLVGQEVTVDGVPHEFKGRQYLGVTVMSKYDDGSCFPKQHNYPVGVIADLAKKLAAVAKTL